jgi:hypothetical protein
MHPAFSVIFFTVISGCGYGLLFLLGIALAANPRLFAGAEAMLVLATGAIFSAAGTDVLLVSPRPAAAGLARAEPMAQFVAVARRGCGDVELCAGACSGSDALARQSSGTVIRVACSGARSHGRRHGLLYGENLYFAENDTSLAQRPGPARLSGVRIARRRGDAVDAAGCARQRRCAGAHKSSRHRRDPRRCLVR